MRKIQTISARSSRAACLRTGESIRVINTHGEQVVDTWAFNAEDIGEFMAMDATRVANLRMTPRVGDSFVTNRRRSILTLTEDTSPGGHDMLMAACDRWRYHALGYDGLHDNCADNLAFALSEMGLATSTTPSPLNLFMHIPWDADGRLRFEPPVSRPGDHVVLKAEIDCIVVMSACPQDMVPVNGLAGEPTEAHFEVV